LDDDQLLRYSRHILLPEIGVEGQSRLRAAHALVIGAGGLGCPAALYLASSGIGRLTLADPDRVDLTNLQRQILYRDDAVGALKVEAAHKTLGAVNPSVTVVPLAELPVVAKDELLQSSVAAVTREGYGYDPARGELWFAGETAEAVLLELEARRRGLAGEAKELEAEAARAAKTAAAAEAGAAKAAAAYAEVAHLKRARPADPAVLARVVAGAERLDEALAAELSRFEAPLRERGETGGARAGELGEELRRLGGVEADLRRELSELGSRVAAAGEAVARLAADPVDTDLSTADAERELADAESRAGEVRERARAAEAAYDEAVPRRLRSLDPERLGEVAVLAERLDTALAAELDARLWPLPPVFRWLAETAPVAAPEMARTFNCGIGMIAVAAPDAAAQVSAALADAGESVLRIGRIMRRPANQGGTILLNAERAWPG